MIEIGVGVVALAALLALAVLAVEWWRTRRLALRDRVVVNLRNGEALAGVLWARRGPYLVLRQANHMDPGNSKPTPLDGETIVDASEVSFVQRAGG